MPRVRVTRYVYRYMPGRLVAHRCIPLLRTSAARVRRHKSPGQHQQLREPEAGRATPTRGLGLSSAGSSAVREGRTSLPTFPALSSNDRTPQAAETLGRIRRNSGRETQGAPAADLQEEVPDIHIVL